jgi:hypothetical protein
MNAGFELRWQPVQQLAALAAGAAAFMECCGDFFGWRPVLWLRVLLC